MSKCCCKDTDKKNCKKPEKHKHEESHNHSHDHNHNHNHSHSGSEVGTLNIYLLIASAVAFIIAALIPAPTYILAIIFGVSTLLAAYDILLDGLKGVFKLRLEEDALLLIAVCAAFVLGEYFEATIVAILFKLGEMLEDYAVGKSRKSTDALTAIRPDYANLFLTDGTVKKVEAETIKINDTIVVRPGDRIPLDCKIISGTSSVDTSAITGESIPVYATAGVELLSGSVNIDGVLTCTVTNDFKSSAASKIVDMVYNSSQNKGETEKFITRFSRYYTPIVIIIAVLLAVIPPLLGVYDFRTWVLRSLIFLVASCPCALVISVPLSFFSTVGALSKSTILTKGSMHIETLSKANCIAFDKTGTLTSGKLQIDKIVIDSDYSQDYILKLASSVEQFSSHPASKAIIERYNKSDFFEATNISEIAGLGVKATVDSKNISCGSYKLIDNNETKLPEGDIYLFESNKLIAHFILKEEIPEYNINLINSLKKVGIKKAVMLTGAGESAAKNAAERCNISEYYSGLLPEDKVKKVALLKEANGISIFVGDGINDAPVLAQADVGVSMGFGSEIANASSDVILASNKLSDIVTGIRISKRGISIMKFNVIFALIIKFIVLVLGAFGLAQMWMAVFADIGVTLITVLNSIRILSSK